MMTTLGACLGLLTWLLAAIVARILLGLFVFEMADCDGC